MVFTYALHERLQKRGSKVKALVAHPGVAQTQLSQGTVSAGGAADMAKMPKWLGGAWGKEIRPHWTHLDNHLDPFGPRKLPRKGLKKAPKRAKGSSSSSSASLRRMPQPLSSRSLSSVLARWASCAAPAIPKPGLARHGAIFYSFSGPSVPLFVAFQWRMRSLEALKRRGVLWTLGSGWRHGEARHLGVQGARAWPCS